MALVFAAASDFTVSGVDDVDVKRIEEIVPAKDAIRAATNADATELQALGNKVAEEEQRASEESKKRMAAIKNQAVSAPESISSLKQKASTIASEERCKRREKTEAAAGSRGKPCQKGKRSREEGCRRGS